MSAILDFLQANWLGLLTLAVVAFGAVTSWRHFRRSKRDVTPRVFFLGEDGNRRGKIKVEHQGEWASPFTGELVVVNVGGSKLKQGKITVTVSHGLQAIDSDSPGWQEDTPTADLDIFGLAGEPDFEDARRMLRRTSSSCLFVRDSDEENVLA